MSLKVAILLCDKLFCAKNCFLLVYIQNFFVICNGVCNVVCKTIKFCKQISFVTQEIIKIINKQPF